MTWILYNPRSGKGRAHAQVQSLSIDWPKHHNVLQKPWPSIAEGEPVIVVGGDGTWHHVNQKVAHTHPAYLVPCGSQNLLAHHGQFTRPHRDICWSHCRAIPTHRIHDTHATINWSFGWDAAWMHQHQVTRYHGLNFLRQALAIPCHQSPQQVYMQGQYLGDFHAGFFSLLPSYGHTLCRLPQKQAWAWHGWLFNKNRRSNALRTFICRRPSDLCNPKDLWIKPRHTPSPLQIDGEPAGFTPCSITPGVSRLQPWLP